MQLINASAYQSQPACRPITTNLNPNPKPYFCHTFCASNTLFGVFATGNKCKANTSDFTSVGLSDCVFSEGQ